MDGYSQTPKEERIKILQSVMPEIFDEGKIDWEKLCAAFNRCCSNGIRRRCDVPVQCVGCVRAR